MTTTDALKQLKVIKDKAEAKLENFRGDGVFRDCAEALDVAITLLKEKAAKERDATIEIGVVLTAYIRTSYEDYTHVYKNVPIVVPDDGNEWHVAGEAWRKKNDKTN